jgi:hypothetical protein
MKSRQAIDDRKLDILVVARMSPRRESRTRRLIRALTPRFNVRVISEAPAGSPEMSGRVDGAQLDEIALPFPGVRLGYLTGWVRVVYFNIHATLAALRAGPETVVCSDSLYCLAGIVSSHFLHRRFIYNSHEIMWALGNAPWLSRFMGWLEKVAIRSCDFWLVPSEERARLILARHRLEKPFVVYENFPILEARPAHPAPAGMKPALARISGDRPTVMFQGSIVPGRGLEQLVQSAQAGGFHLVIQGEGPLLDQIGRRENRNITFLEACPNAETVEWLRQADLSFVYYENNGLNAAYACSSKFYASVFAGVPILCNRLPAFQSFGRKYGGVAFFDSLDPQTIAACIRNALEPERHARLKREIRDARGQLMKIRLERRIARAFSGALEASAP